MSHAHHFLERLDRVTREQTEFALGLYRDHEAVRYLLDHVNLPAEAERVALAVDDPREGPFVLVTREGRFVTCLGKGMHHQHPVVPRPRVDALLAKVAEMRARREMAQRDLRPDEDEDDVVHRLMSRGSRFAREDFVALMAFAPTIGGAAAWELMREFALDANKFRKALIARPPRVSPIPEKSVRALDAFQRMEWVVAHLTVLACAGERRDLDELVEASRGYPTTPMFACACQGGMPFLMRSAWASARLGRGVVPKYKEVLAKADDFTTVLDAAMGLGAIALRHASAAADVERILASYGEPCGDLASMEYARGWAAHSVARVVEASEEQEKLALENGRLACVTFGARLPEGHPLRFAERADVPEDLVRTMILALDLDTWTEKVRGHALSALPVAARASAEDFFLPREVVRAWFGRWTPAEAIDRLERLPNAVPRREPVRAAPSVGRNDPCTCGSGKKWKKCCGAPAAGSAAPA